jgi:hypothetical protein
MAANLMFLDLVAAHPRMPHIWQARVQLPANSRKAGIEGKVDASSSKNGSQNLNSISLFQTVELWLFNFISFGVTENFIGTDPYM